MKQYIRPEETISSDKTDCPEKRLFTAVLSQAVHDAFSNHVEGIEKRQALHFLTHDSHSLRIICEMAGRNPNYVIQKITKRLHHGE